MPEFAYRPIQSINPIPVILKTAADYCQPPKVFLCVLITLNTSLTRVSVFLGGTITEMVGGCQEFWSKSRAMRLSAITTSLQPDTAGQKDAFIEPARDVKGVEVEEGKKKWDTSMRHNNPSLHYSHIGKFVQGLWSSCHELQELICS